MTVLQSIRARFGAVVPWGIPWDEQGWLIPAPQAGSRAAMGSGGSPRHQEHPWGQGRAQDGSQGQPGSVGSWQGRAGLVPYSITGGDIPGEAEPGSWAMGRVGTAPGSWAVPVVASEPGTQQLLLVQK